MLKNRYHKNQLTDYKHLNKSCRKTKDLLQDNTKSIKKQ